MASAAPWKISRDVGDQTGPRPPAVDTWTRPPGPRNGRTQASIVRRAGNGALNRLAGYLTGRPIPDLTSGFRAARREYLRDFLHMLPNGFSTPTTTTLAFIKAGYNVTFVPVRTGAVTCLA